MTPEKEFSIDKIRDECIDCTVRKLVASSQQGRCKKFFDCYLHQCSAFSGATLSQNRFPLTI